MPVLPPPAADPFFEEEVPVTNPGPARARAAVEAAEQPLNTPRRAAQFAPAEDIVKLSQVAGQELLIYTVQDQEGEYGLYVDCLTACADEPDVTFILRVGASVKTKLIAVREAVQRGEVSWPVLARFDEIALKNGNTCWILS